MESPGHIDLKKKAEKWLKNEHEFGDEEIERERTVTNKNNNNKKYRIDVVGIKDNFKVAVECGYITGTSKEKDQKVNFLRREFDEYKRFSYLKTNKSRRYNNLSKCSENHNNEFLDDILKKFPYNSKSNQLEILTEFFLLNAGQPPKEVKERLNIHHSTQRKIRAAWNDLKRDEQAFLWNQMSQYLTLQSTSEEPGPEKCTGQ